MPWLIDRLLAFKTWILRSKNKQTRPMIRRGAFLVSLFVFSFAAMPVHAAELNVDSILKIFADFAFNIAAVLTKGIVLLIDVMVPIMTYNNFVGNPVVSAGWAIVRDTVNMFFVVVLIIIAFGTIIGHQRFKWAQQVPRLLVMAVLINFSKTLCGIMIDFGQVIMLTFANALREIAAGNFIQLLGLNQIYQVSQSSAAIKNIEQEAATGISQAFDFFASGVMSVVLTLWVLGTLIILTAILLFRIVMLWILVVIAPLAWFVKGAEDIIKSNAYAEWWGEFKCLVGVGPVLAFFLWLTLAVAGAGNVAANSGFTVSAESNNADFTSSLLEVNNFLSFLIGMAMLYAGFKAATQFCSGISGQFVSGALNKYAKRIPAITAGVVGAAGATGVGVGLKGASIGARAGLRGLAATPRALSAGGRYVPGSDRAYRAVSSARESVKTFGYEAVEKAGAGLGLDSVERFGSKRKGQAKDLEGQRRVQEIAKQKEGLKGMSRDTVANLAEKYAGLKVKPSTVVAKAEAMAVLDQAMGDSRLQTQLRASGALQKLWEEYGGQMEQDYAHDSAKSASISDFKKANADFTNSADKLDDYDDVKDLSTDALADTKVQERLKEIRSNKQDGNGKTLTAYEAIAQGYEGQKKAAALSSGVGGRFDRMGNEELKRVSVNQIGEQGSAEAIKRAIEVAMRQGEASRAKDLVSQMATRYQEEKEPKKKIDMLLALDSTAGTLASSKGRNAGDVLKHLNQARSTAEAISPPPNIMLEQGQKGADFAEEMKNASPERKAGIVQTLTAQQQSVSEQLAQTRQEKDTLVGTRAEGLDQELKALTDTLAQTTTDIDKELKDKTNSLRMKLVQARTTLENVLNNPSSPQQYRDDAQTEVDRLTVEYNESKKVSTWPEDRRAAIESDQRIKDINRKIEEKTQEIQGFNAEELEEVKTLTTQISGLENYVEELTKAREGITSTESEEASS